MAITEGSVLLKKALEPAVPARMKPSELAKELGVSHQAVNDWVRGRNPPRRELMARIEDLLGIPMRAWVEEAQGEEGVV